MQTSPIELTDVTYNAAEQSFEALATVHDGVRTRKYACSLPAPVTLSLEDAAQGLAQQATRQHLTHAGLHSRLSALAAAPRRRFLDDARIQYLRQFFAGGAKTAA